MQPRTRFTRSGNVHIAYQVVGEGPFDLVYVPGWVSHVELAWEEPTLASFLERLASFSRLIVFDKRGTGLSDRVPDDQLPSHEERMDDIRAVMDAAGSERAAFFGVSEGGGLAALFAATYPQRTTALVLCGSFAKRIWSPDYPWAPTPEQREREYEVVEREWGGMMDVAHYVPTMVNDEAFKERLATYMRRAASPGAAVTLLRMNTRLDYRAVLPAIRVPTLVVHRLGDLDVSIENGRYLAKHIPDARLVELPGNDHLPWVGKPTHDADRVLATVLVTDIVGSTELAARIGDRAFTSLLDRHHHMVRRELSRFRGHEVNTTGDGFIATFDGPGRAIRCAFGIRDGARELGLATRAGLHTGEVEDRAGEIGGIAVNIGARVAAMADVNETLVSSTVKDLVTGAGIAFADRGARILKGVPGEWRLYAAS
ncbi:MAG: adenylate/guanylate cyclase domain-containing protein [Betaproteobacteria bacterium]|nr:MAG: adenylate/guanylate cyclase domain-containing protein [Betaproteobacteria bacterium]